MSTILSRRAASTVFNAVCSKKLTRPKQCELCYRTPEPGLGMSGIVAHHWKGYDYPLDVWWICVSCNRHLEHKHDGSLTREQAREYIQEKKLKALEKDKKDV